ncbi:hypothetical protein [Leisingera sp. ANG59]|uniref:hypothetical protein n=1 Tax=Leisingera sp. ANG59 TaxID=2675221 RepID=UPI0015734ED3|nr:hypothetical protein [Leisingera sp. ANG59]NSY38130.1 hypothetical protein [Leisingera sp. ANG59]
MEIEKQQERHFSVRLSDKDRNRVNRRVKCILDGRKAASGLSHLKYDDLEKLETQRDGVRLIGIPNGHRADEIAVELHQEMPWMAPATEIIWRAMRRSLREGWPGLRMPPILLDGPPGIGKSHWARRLGQIISTPSAVIEATAENATISVVGNQRGWNGS